MSIRLLSWNILQGGGKRTTDIAARIESLQPDIVTLQEFRGGKTAPIILDVLNRLGLEYQHTVEASASKNTVMLAANTPFETKPWAAELDSRLCAQASFEISTSSISSLELFAGHLPQKRAQVPYFTTLGKLNADDFEAAMIIGDLNCGIPFEDSETKSFVNTHLFQNLLRNGWVDTWRERNPTSREYTWISARGNGYRYDHCLANKHTNKLISNVEYIQSVREDGLSDHAAMLVELS